MKYRRGSSCRWLKELFMKQNSDWSGGSCGTQSRQGGQLGNRPRGKQRSWADRHTGVGTGEGDSFLRTSEVPVKNCPETEGRGGRDSVSLEHVGNWREWQPMVRKIWWEVDDPNDIKTWDFMMPSTVPSTLSFRNVGCWPKDRSKSGSFWEMALSLFLILLVPSLTSTRHAIPYHLLKDLLPQ